MMSNEIYPLRNETGELNRIGIEIHKRLGSGFLEIVYKDAIEYELLGAEIEFEREKEYLIKYKDITLPHKFFADFVVYNSVILEVKSKERIADEDLAQTLNYLKCSGCKIGLILNFAKTRLDIKRVAN